MNTIEKKVKGLIKKYKTNDPFELASCLNIKVYTDPLGHIKGFYKYIKRTKVIFINDDLDDSWRRVVCAHELGHAILHPRLNKYFIEQYTFFVEDKIEKEANKFAAELLISDDLLHQYPDYFNLEQIASSEHIPNELLELLKLKFDI